MVIVKLMSNVASIRTVVASVGPFSCARLEGNKLQAYIPPALKTKSRYDGWITIATLFGSYWTLTRECKDSFESVNTTRITAFSSIDIQPYGQLVAPAINEDVPKRRRVIIIPKSKD